MQQPVIAIFDLDHTITRRDTYLAFLVHFLICHPGRLLKSAWLPLALTWHKAGKRDNTWLKKTFLRSIAAGTSREEIERCTEPFLHRLLINGIRPGAEIAIRRHREAGDFLLMVTASFDFYARRLGELLGFDDVIATHSKWDSAGRLTGAIKGDNCYGPVKLDRLNSYLDRWEQRPQTIAYSDHYSDAPLLGWVDHPVVVNPKPKFREIAERMGYEVQDWEVA